MNRTSIQSLSSARQPVPEENGAARCAIYTRKSTDEGLEQEFNSLDAQRESAEAYIVSQRHEGWSRLPERYDDGGFTGGNMERPALQRLFADIEAGEIDCVVVYKVDRLSRSLLDFARMMELFDKHAVSLVSVTQQFNTTSSMGRLTYNTLRRNGQTGGKAVRNKYGALLKGILYCALCGTGMIHTYTNKNGRLYRYYVCLNAQQRGWSSCPSKSLNAQEIENAEVEHIRGIGSNETIIAATSAKVREESEKRLAELNKERQSHERVLKRLHARVQKLMSESFSVASDQKLAIDQLADLQDQIGSLDQQMTAIREEVISIQKEAVDEGDLARALTAFPPLSQFSHSR